jgi:lipid II:glycine glycyltransferase (peptidoglycan interpeptide bridge formation enzyme)
MQNPRTPHHLYQSNLWAKFQQAQGRLVLNDSGEGWDWMAAMRAGRGGIKYLYAAYGPTAAGAAELSHAVNSLKREGRERRADFVRLEPLGFDVDETAMKKLGARKVSDMQPRYRLIQDISPDEAELRKNISSSNRNLINTAEKRGLSFVVSPRPADLSHFLAMQAETTARGGFTAQPDEYYEKLAAALMPTGQAKLYFAEYAGQPIAGAICVDYEGTRYYLYAATYPEANREHKAAIALLWWLIADAKDKGLNRFDYGGVAPEDASADHPWAGHTRFKRSIGGEVFKSVGTWEIPVKRGKYALYGVARRVLER